MSNRIASHTAVAALAVELIAGSVPSEFRYLPIGRFKSADGSGRPVGVVEGWSLTRQRADQIVAQSALRASRRVIDYEHQTLRSAENGKPAPASGWMGRYEVRDDGLYAVDVEWTAQAAAMIAAGEYRYISPVFPYDSRTGEVLGVAHAALTNDPGLDGLTDLARLSALIDFPIDFPTEEEPPMKTLLAALGLSETATEAQAVAALSALRDGHNTALAALKSQSPDPAQFVAVATLAAVNAELATTRSELAALKAVAVDAEVNQLVAESLAAGKLTPATEAWARDLGKTNLAALKAFIGAAPIVVAPGTTQSGGASTAASQTQTTDTDLAVMKALGLSAEQFAAGKQGA